MRLYFHIPFCTRKCAYCHFYVIPDNGKAHLKLLEGLLLELDSYHPILEKQSIDSIYFGGGTPALFGPENIGKVLQKISNWNQKTEITLEANPENITLELMQKYREIGINRVSIGVQSFDDHLLHVLTRTHSSKKAIDTISWTKEAGIDNISIDLMFDLPGQTLNQWEASLEQALALPITHLSLYNLTIEPHTLFYRDREKLIPSLPNEEMSAEMYKTAQEKCFEGGFRQYEISAYCREGYVSKHNSGYWLGDPFLGLGPSAFSFYEGSRFKNVSHLGRYLEHLRNKESPVDFSERLSPESSKRELLAIGIRLLEGVELLAFEKKWGKLDQETLLKLDTLSADGFLNKINGRVSLTEQGVLHYDTVAQELI